MSDDQATTYVTKFYDRDGKEQPPEKASWGVRLTLRGGRVSRTDRFYAAEKETIKPVSASGDFDEEDHPRDNAGRFASKGMVPAVRQGEGDSATWKLASGEDLPDHASRLHIPPAWTGVHIHPDSEADLLAVGYDSKGREQRVYSQRFIEQQSAEKFARNTELMRDKKEVFADNERNLSHADAHVRDDASCMKLVMATGLRPGSDEDTLAKVKAYGATTLQGRHVVEDNGRVRLVFTGKKGVALDIPVEDQAVAKDLLERKAAAGDGGKLFDTDSSRLRDYAHSMLDSGRFKPKDFRTLKGTETAVAEIGERPERCSTVKEFKKRVIDVAKKVASKLGNTPSVALNSYINPSVWASIRPAGMEAA